LFDSLRELNSNKEQHLGRFHRCWRGPRATHCFSHGHRRCSSQNPVEESWK
jgi:hypothetical protein